MFYSDFEVTIDLKSNDLALFIQKASRYEADVFIKKGELKANAKSLLGLLSLRITTNDKVTLLADGSDAAKAIEGLKSYLQS